MSEKFGMSAEQIGQLGASIGMAMSKANNQYGQGVLPREFKAYTDMTPSTTNIYGRYSIFDPCSNGDVFGLQVATVGLMNWIGWRPNQFYRRHVDFITWMGPEGTAAGSPRTGAIAPCDDPYSWEYGYCGYDLLHTSWYGIAGQSLDPHTITQVRCETTPRYRLNGVQIMDDVEWQMNGILNVLQQQLRHALVTGSHDNAHEMNGLESLIKTGYTGDNGENCAELDSIVKAWNDNLDGAVNNLGNFFDYLDEVVTEIEYRSSAIGTISETDMVLFTSRFMATCLLDAYACYTTCGVTDTGDVTDQALRAQQRAARMALNGGPLYDGAAAVGFLNLKSGRRLPIIVDDTFTITKPVADYCTDIYLLTRRIGSIDVLYGEYLDMRIYENRVKAQMPMFTARADAAGRFVTKGKEDNFCVQLIMGTSPEIYLSAPWAQVRFENVCCSRKRQPISSNVFSPKYLPGGTPLHKVVVNDENDLA